MSILRPGLKSQKPLDPLRALLIGAAERRAAIAGLSALA